MRITLTLITALLAAHALAHDETPCTQEPDSKWQPFSVALKKAEDAGAKPKVAEIHHKCYEIRGKDKNGKSFEWVLNPVTLEQRVEKQ
ncbi:PepSY domain-containing protein [Chitinimonas sp.]|uniref:PepSY domain-containing protein n=1 Tax=Chitinimonas sp. TaxID=1934313 RepID=UPI0035B4DD0B